MIRFICLLAVAASAYAASFSNCGKCLLRRYKVFLLKVVCNISGHFYVAFYTILFTVSSLQGKTLAYKFGDCHRPVANVILLGGGGHTRSEQSESQSAGCPGPLLTRTCGALRRFEV